MQIPLQISFRNMDHSQAVETRIREEVEKLTEFYKKIMACRVVVEVPHRRQIKGKPFHIHIQLLVPDGEINAGDEPKLERVDRAADEVPLRKDIVPAAPHKDVYIAIRDAFRAARRQLLDYASERRGEVKFHPKEENETSTEPLTEKA